MRSVPGYLDRYPAKMVSRLAGELVDRYCPQTSTIVDPFCGSASILSAAQAKGHSVIGIDVNPYATLLAGVKLQGFSADTAVKLYEQVCETVHASKAIMPIGWSNKDYWFTVGTIQKFERIRMSCNQHSLNRSPEGRAILLALALSVRRCSRADQRSPKPYISRTAKTQRAGRHFDPLVESKSILGKLASYYGTAVDATPIVETGDIRVSERFRHLKGSASHVITSPPYINAQDYFRNSKLELHILEGLIPFSPSTLQELFIGTERGDLLAGIGPEQLQKNRDITPFLIVMEHSHPTHAKIVHRYLCDMDLAFDAMKQMMTPQGTMVIVCGDNLVAGYQIPTWQVLNALLATKGFAQFDSFGDVIARRYVPPTRQGHKGMVKQEVVTAMRLG